MRVIWGRLRPPEAGDEGGAVAVMVAIAMVAILGMVVLTVDFGGLAVKRRAMVNSNDAAALAAAQTFARNLAAAGSNEGPAQTQADSLATQNVANAVHNTSQSWWTVSAGLSGQPCAPTTCGSVTVRYQGDQSLFFAPIIGLANVTAIRAAATAIWGPAGGGSPAPIMIRSDWMNFECDAPVPNNTPPTNCAFWLNDHDDNGNPLWAWVNLNPYPGGTNPGWDVPRTYNCPNVSSGDRTNWILGINVATLPINTPPTPTFVCTVTGHAAANFADMQTQIGKYKTFPINDAAGVIAPPGQVDKNGAYCPPSTPCTPDKYDIVGFTVLRLDNVLRGDDPAATGTPGSSGDCTNTRNFKKGDVLDLDTLSGTGCPNTTQTDILTPNPPGLLSVSGIPVSLTLYTYAAATHTVTWTGPTASGKNVDIKFHWQILPQLGKCSKGHPTMTPDPNAICLVASWQGYQAGGINPGGGGDFGLRAVRLSV